MSAFVLGPYASVTYAQEGEDRVLSRMFPNQSRGFYIDIGSHHPIRFSNTYLFYRQGWNGIAIDPAPLTSELFRKVRPRDIAVVAAVGGKPGTFPYYEFDEPALNTLSKERADHLVGTTRYELRRTTQVPVERLDSILRRYVPSGTEIDILSTDTEGMDEEVLSSNDWATFRPRVIVAELLEVDSIERVESSPVTALLRSHGYRPHAKTGNSVIFVQFP